VSVAAAGVVALLVIACDGKGTTGKAPALSKAVAARHDANLFTSVATPGSVPCGASSACPISKASRKMCCNAPGVPPTCKDASKCGQATQFKYSGLLECNESADCTGKDAVCCLTDDGNRAESSPSTYNRSMCMPRTSCRGADAVACASSADCAGMKGTVCRKTSLGVGVEVGACLP
jgi:hypothetical protein